MKVRLAAILRRVAARLDPDREYVINTAKVHVHIDAEQIERSLRNLRRRPGDES